MFTSKVNPNKSEPKLVGQHYTRCCNWLEHLQNPVLSHTVYWDGCFLLWRLSNCTGHLTSRSKETSAICHAACSCAVYLYTHTDTQSYFNAVTFSEKKKTCLRWQPAFHAIKLLSLNTERERERDQKTTRGEWQWDRKILKHWQNVCMCVGGVWNAAFLLLRRMSFLVTTYVRMCVHGSSASVGIVKQNVYSVKESLYCIKNAFIRFKNVFLKL